jgi:hypothetical protein
VGPQPCKSRHPEDASHTLHRLRIFYRGKGNITQPSTNATPRKVRKTVAPYWSRSFGDSFEVSEKTMETQNAKIVRAVKCDSSMRLFLSSHRNIEGIQDD